VSRWAIRTNNSFIGGYLTSPSLAGKAKAARPWEIVALLEIRLVHV